MSTGHGCGSRGDPHLFTSDKATQTASEAALDCRASLAMTIEDGRSGNAKKAPGHPDAFRDEAKGMVSLLSGGTIQAWPRSRPLEARLPPRFGVPNCFFQVSDARDHARPAQPTSTGE